MSNQRKQIESDFSNVGKLLGRAFFGDEPLRDILTGRAEPTSTPAVSPSATCPVCGAAPEDAVEKRMITRADKKTIPCPACLTVAK
jgi:hypothetical protein